MIFKTKIRDYTGSSPVIESSSTYTTDNAHDDKAQRYLIDGCYDVIEKIRARKGVDDVQKFGIWSDPLNSGTSLDIDEVREIVFIQRNGIPATRVSPSLIHKFTDTDSIHYASVNDPVFYLQEQYLTIKPAPAADALAYYIYIPNYAVTNYTSGTSSIDKFPAEYYEHVCMYASLKVLEDLMQNYIEDDEDSELAQLTGARIDRLKVQYNEMFGAAQ
jgi:hypothetical protein